jgi:predicted GNAT superfamily acetyltransferase
MPRFQIRRLQSLVEFRACERIQTAVWGNVGVGSEVMSVTAKYGGAVIGAVTGGEVTGFLYAFLARRHGRLIHWSHLMAVEPRYRDRGLGFRMKLAHRRLALARGIKSICWTYDPLQSRNAALNVRRLGGFVDEYIENCYGRFPSRIEKGLPSDRLVVDWRIGSASIAQRLTAEGAEFPNLDSLPRANETRVNARGLIENHRLRLDLRAPRVAVEIPANTDAMRSKDLRLAQRWRLETRKTFERYFSRRYRVVDFVPPGREGGGRCFYILGRANALVRAARRQ